MNVNDRGKMAVLDVVGVAVQKRLNQGKRLVEAPKPFARIIQPVMHVTKTEVRPRQGVSALGVLFLAAQECLIKPHGVLEEGAACLVRVRQEDELLAADALEHLLDGLEGQ